MYHFIANYLTDAAYPKISTEVIKFTMGHTSVGYILIKFLIKNAIIKTRDTDTCLQENVMYLDTYITTVNSNFDTFNQFLKLNVDVLKARGKSIDNIMVNIVKAYQLESDAYFVRYLNSKKTSMMVVNWRQRIKLLHKCLTGIIYLPCLRNGTPFNLNKRRSPHSNQ